MQVKLEYAARNTLDARSDDNVAVAVSDLSRMDYAITSIRSDGNPLFFVMEAKRGDPNADEREKAIAQVCRLDHL